ncbi:MAG: ATP-binding protein [Thermoproteota archaeon]|nr:ATP-binding protein [Thermoproteota archaeon]
MNDGLDRDNDSHTFSRPLSSSLNSSLDSNKNVTTPSIAQQQQPSIEKTEIWYDEEKAMNGLAQVMSNVKNSADVCGDHLSPSFSMGVEQIKKGYIDFKRRGIKIRFITKIIKENLSYCKELIQYVELRHITEVKGNMAVSETEYVATAKLEGEAKPVTQTIYSNVKAIIEQHKYFFENLWEKAIPYEQRIREIEEGIEPIKTEVLENEEEISKRIIDLPKKSNDLRIYSTTGGMQLIYNNFFKEYKDVVQRYRNGEHKGIRWITSINSQNDIELVTLFLNEGIKVRHVKNVPFSSFALSDKLLNSTVEKMEEGKMVTNLLSSNDTLYRNHYDVIFKELWKTGIDAKSRIKDIKEGRYINVELIPNPIESLKFVSELNKSAKEEILILLSSEMGFLRTEKNGGFRYLNKIASNGIKVKVLTPSKFTTENKIADQIIKSKYPHIEFRNLQSTYHAINRIIIFDMAKTMIFEIKDDALGNYSDIVGMAIYIESKSTALSYASIFDSLWKQTELYEQLKKGHEHLKIHEQMQKEFIDIAGHELRTPLLPILGLAQHVRNKIKDKEQIELLDIVIRNTKKLKKLTEDILDVARIEGKLFNPNKEYFSLNQLISNIVKEYENNFEKDKKIRFEFAECNIEYLLYADITRVGQVISNLINNSINFIPEERGRISINIEKKECHTDGDTKKIVVVCVKDNGNGINSEIVTRLFTKFASKSFHGTGLGLYISKSIVEAHGGKIWGENNKDEKGATFCFSLPLKD